MLLLSNKFQTIRINHGGNIDLTLDGPDIDSIQVLEPSPTTAQNLKPDVTWITGPDDEIVPDVDAVKELKPNVKKVKDLKPRPWSR